MVLQWGREELFKHFLLLFCKGGHKEKTLYDVIVKRSVLQTNSGVVGKVKWNKEIP